MSRRRPRRTVNRGVARRKAVRRVSRLVLVIGLLVVIVAPVSWERLPDFGLVFVPPTGEPPGPPGPGIDPTGEPPGPRIISPQNPAPESTTGEFAYMDLFDGQPPFHSTCDPVPFEIRTEAAPANGDELIFDALQRLADTSGLSFEFVGYTDSIYKFNDPRVRFPWEDDRDSLWVGWATNDEVPDLGPRSDDEPYAIGVGGPIVSGDSRKEVLGGGVVLRAGENLPYEFGPGANSGNVLLHELGHAMGLDHVQSTTEQMQPSLSDQSPDGYAAGDTRGLQGMTLACG